MSEKLKKGTRKCVACNEVISIAVRECPKCKYHYPRKPKPSKPLKAQMPKEYNVSAS